VYRFAQRDCEEAMVNGQRTIQCGAGCAGTAEAQLYCRGTVALELLVPDIALIDVRNSRIASRDIEIQEIIGEGASGKCYRGLLRGSIAVAIKDLMIRPKATAAAEQANGTNKASAAGAPVTDSHVIQLFHSFRNECRLMSKLRHPNVVNLEGFCTDTFQMVCELVEGGDLYSFLNDPHSLMSKANKIFDALKSLDKVQLGMQTMDEQDYQAAETEAIVCTQECIERFSSSAQAMLRESPELHDIVDSFTANACIRLGRASKEADDNLLQSFQSLSKRHAAALPQLPWEIILRIAIDIARGLGFLHSLNPPVLHRDLKTPNCLLTVVPTLESIQSREVLAKVSDFGFSSQLFIPTLRAAQEFENREVNLPTWLAPEILAKCKYSMRSDVYAFGIILWELYTRQHPFKEYMESSAFMVCPKEHTHMTCCPRCCFSTDWVIG
jgi:serine/threonine protein kinase